MLSVDTIKTLIGKRKLYIWGSGHFGASISTALARIGLEITGFLDSSMAGQQFLGFQVEYPDEILAQGKEKIYVIISAFLFTDVMAKRCEAYGFLPTGDYLTHAEIKAYHFEIDVSGFCNLRCVTCPRGNLAFRRKEDCMMSAVNYQKILNKLLQEVPLLADVQLYSWGEPLLNPELPEMISFTREKGVAVAISSNLSLKCDLASVLQSEPTWFRISLSGYDQQSYQTIHKGGNWELILANMENLASLRAKFAPKMFVDVNYHLYKHNQHGLAKIAALCKKLGFVFRTNYAFLDPLDAIIEYAEGKALPVAISEGRGHLLLDIDDAIDLSRKSGEFDCVSQNSFVVNSDLSFRRCTHFYQDEENVLASNFLETPLGEILERAENCPLCRRCREAGVHRFHFAYISKGTETEALIP